MKRYVDFFNIARTTKVSLPHKQFRPGVERAAALAAVEQEQHGCGMEAVITVIQEEFDRYEIKSPRWDGSVA